MLVVKSSTTDRLFVPKEFFLRSQNQNGWSIP
jgi:hypothetical protein